MSLTRIGLSVLAVTALANFALGPNEDKPAAILNINHGLFALGVWVSRGSGTLTYKGKDYTVTASGLSISKVGFSKVAARGNVYNLKTLKDFNDTYTAGGAGMTLAGGRSAVALKNQHNVKVALFSTSKGLMSPLAEKAWRWN